MSDSVLNTSFHHPKHKMVILLTLLSVLFFLLTLYQRGITGDDVWFAEQAYWFAKNGQVRSDLFEGYPLFENQVLVYHKLHIWQGALAYKLFGWNVYVFKAIPLLYIAGFLVGVFYFLKKQAADIQPEQIFWLFLILFFTNNLVIFFGFEFRPDIMMMCTGFLSFDFLYRAQQHSIQWFSISAGLLAGITALFHLNGLIFIAAGLVLLLLNRNYLLLPAFAFGACLGFLPYLYEIMSIDKIYMFLDALRNDPAVSDEDKSAYGWIWKLLLEYKRFTHHTYEFFYFLLFVVVVASNWKAIRGHHLSWQLFVYSLLLTFFMALITTGKKTVYLLYTLPFMTLLIAMYFNKVFASKKLLPWFGVIIIFYLISNLGHSYSLYRVRNDGVVARHALIRDRYHIKDGDEIFAPFPFIFNEIGKVRIQSFLPYILKYNHDFTKITLQTVFEDIHRRKKSFAILDPYMLKDLDFTPEHGKTYYGYQYLGQEGNLFVFKPI